MITVPEAARRAGRDPETVRRWIRSGKLRSQKVGTQHLIDEGELDAIVDGEYEMLPLPDPWKQLPDGSPMPNVVRWIRQSREGR